MADVLGSEPRARRPPRLLAPALVAVLVLLLALDRVQASREAGALVARAQAVQAAADRADRRVAALVQYAGSALRTGPAAQDLQRLVQAEAAASAPVVERGRRDVLRLRVLPWHRDARRAREAVAEHAEQRAAGLAAVARGATPERVDAAPARRALARVSSPRRAARVYR